MKTHAFSRFLAMALVVVMLVGVLPANAFAASINYAEREDDYYKVISKKDWELAPGIVESEIVLNNDAGTHRQVAHVVEVDIDNPYTKVIPSTYKMAEGLENKEYRTQIMSAQAAYAEANGYGNVVAAMNIALSWYNSSYYAEHPELVGEPLGYLVLDGVMYANSQGQSSGAQTCLVINFDEKDGVARPSDIPKTEIRSTSTAITGWEEQVIPANFGFLVKDGVNQYSKNHTSDAASRSFIGIKENGDIVIVMNDGRQSPYSAGFNSYEMAEFMLSLGCVQAVNGDGGGSSAFLSQRPGEELKVNCAPSDGAERDTTHGILVISTAPATGEFVRASISTDNVYYTPGSSVQFNAVGTDLVGTEAEIPADVVWQLADESMGTIEDGLFVSNGTLGEVTAQMVWNGAVVGEATIQIVIPEISFKQDTLVMPYGEAVELSVNATTNEGLNEVAIKTGDIVFTLSDTTMGTIDGNIFTTTDDTTVTGGTISAVICGDTENAVSATIKFGKASEIVYDFEDGKLPVDTSNTGNIGGDDAEDTGEYIYGWHISDTRKNGYFSYRYYGKKSYTPVGLDIPTKLYLVDKNSGMVRNGDYAMAVNIDWTNVTASCHGQMDLALPESLDLTDATRVGFWMYLPAEVVTASMQVSAGFRNKRVDYKLNDVLDGTTGTDNGGWYYFSWEVLDTYGNLEYIQINSHYTAGEGNYNYYQNVTYYIDDITVDYSDATIDRENPYFTGVTISSGDVEKTVEDGYTVSDNVVTLFAQAQENTTKNNFTGLKASSVKVTVDGQAVTNGVSVSAAGKVSVVDLHLDDGVHTIVFEISDNQGNVGNIVRKLIVNTEKSAVRLEVPAASGLLPTGSIYWLNLVADDLTSIDSVTTTINLDYVNEWELEGMEVAYGFEAEYYINNHNDAVITFTRIGTEVADSTILAKLPVRIWMATSWMDDSGIRANYISDNPAMQDKYYILTPHAMWYSDGTRDYRLVVSAEAGVVTYLDGSIETFSANETVIQTEMNRYYSNSDKQGKWSFHICTPGTAESKEATCTTAGYTDRVFCVGCACGTVENLGTECDTHNGCGSVIDWGTIVPATGHDFGGTPIVGLHECFDCDAVFYYIDGVAQTGWVEVHGTYYYCDKNGLVVDGVVTIDGHTYTFVDHVLTDGSWEHDGVGLTCWWAGELISGNSYDTHWKTINGNKYYFNNIYANVGVAKVQTNNSGATWYNLFDENGVFMEDFSGVAEDHVFDKGVMVRAYQLVEVDGDYYFINDGHRIAKNTKLYLSERFVEGKTFADGRDILPGYYTFDAEGKMEIPELKHGVVGDYLYINDVKQVRYQLVEFEGNFYFINDGDKIYKGGKLYLSEKFVEGKTFADGSPITAGYYEFDADGKMIIK